MMDVQAGQTYFINQYVKLGVVVDGSIVDLVSEADRGPSCADLATKIADCACTLVKPADAANPIEHHRASMKRALLVAE